MGNRAWWFSTMLLDVTIVPDTAGACCYYHQRWSSHSHVHYSECDICKKLSGREIRSQYWSEGRSWSGRGLRRLGFTRRLGLVLLETLEKERAYGLPFCATSGRNALYPWSISGPLINCAESEVMIMFRGMRQTQCSLH
jgi:hypothetical protein